jgi:drug/metabolite transporter (DMT)-like permease
MQTKMYVILLVAFCALLGAAGQVFFKLSSKSLSFNLLSLATNWKLIIGLVLYGLATVLFLIMLRQGNLSILYPIIATSYIWVALFSTIFLQEAFPAYKWAGVLLIIGGVIVIVR